MMSRAAGQATGQAAAQPDLSSITLLSIDLIPDQWWQMSVAEKAAHIAAKLGIDPSQQILLISRLDQMFPRPVVIQHRERLVCVPMRSVPDVRPNNSTAPAGQAGPMITGSGIAIWGLLFAIAGGLMYASIHAKD